MGKYLFRYKYKVYSYYSYVEELCYFTKVTKKLILLKYCNALLFASLLNELLLRY